MVQMIADLAEQGIGGIKPEARDETRGLPLSDSRYPKGATIAGDETKIRYSPIKLSPLAYTTNVDCSGLLGCMTCM